MNRRSRPRPYTRGELNRAIDALVHPLAKRDTRLFALDAALHALVEKNPPVSVRKFVRYDLPLILSKLEGTDAGLVTAGNRLIREISRLYRKAQHGTYRRRRKTPDSK